MTSSPTAAITPIVMSSMGGVLLLPTAIVLPVFFHEQFVYFVLGVFTDAFDQRYGERLLVRTARKWLAPAGAPHCPIADHGQKIGRASCRASVCRSVKI